MSSRAGHHRRLKFPARLEIVPQVRKKVQSFLIEECCGENQINELILAIDELCNNTVEHGTLDKSDSLILEIEVHTPRREITCSLLSPECISAPELHRLMNSCSLPDLHSERGRGLFLFRAMVDDFSVRRNEEGLLELSFKKTW